MITQEDAVEIIESGKNDAYGLMSDADDKFIKRFNKIDKDLIKLLADVRKHFPDATYYTGSGGFNLLLGESHNDKGQAQTQLVAFGGLAAIGDGDF
jgi:hypothetical protein